MAAGQQNVIPRERDIVSSNKYSRNTLDIAGFHYHPSCVSITIDGTHRTGIRDLVQSLTLAGIMAGASGLLVESHLNPVMAKSDGFQGLFPARLACLVSACQQVWKLRQYIEPLCVRSVLLEQQFEERVNADKTCSFGA